MNISEVEKCLGVVFVDKHLLMQVFTHKSYLNENHQWPVGHSERLEYLGDAVLELVVSEFLFRKYPNKAEGQLTQYRQGLVCNDTHTSIALTLGLESFLLLSRGEANDRGRARDVRLADAYEALIGAIYLDQGFEAVRAFIERHLLSNSYEVIAKGIRQDTKSRLQEFAQKHEKVTPSYRVLEESGPAHERQYVAGVFFAEDLVGKGMSSSKRRAEEEAARMVLESRGWLVA